MRIVLVIVAVVLLVSIAQCKGEVKQHRDNLSTTIKNRNLE